MSLQQFYNLVDTWVVGRYLGKRALAAVGASYTLMTFLTSVVIGLCLGQVPFCDGIRQARKGDFPKWDFYVLYGNWRSFDRFDNIVVWICKTTYLLVPAETVEDMVTYLIYVFAGFFATFCITIFASVLRSIGNSVLPLVFLGISVALNIGLDLLFVVTFSFGIGCCRGNRYLPVHSWYRSYALFSFPVFRFVPCEKDFTWKKKNFRQILSLSGFTCLQSSQ